MSIKLLMKRYGVKNSDIDVMLTGMLANESLDGILKHLTPDLLTKEQLYTILRKLSLSQFGENLEYIAPHLVLERQEMSAPLKDSWLIKREKFLADKKEKIRQEDILLAEMEKNRIKT